MRQLCIYAAMLTCIAFFAAIPVRAQKFADLAATPPMGWNSWNKFACDGINETVIRETADALVASGMQAAGYRYIVIDDCWQVSRDSAGNIVADAVKFPHGIKALADYVHSKGLKFGIYTCAGSKTCAGRPASRGYEFQDARQYAAWGVDYLKEDWCNTSTQDAKESYILMRDALYKAGRPIVFSLCEWGSHKPWHWAAEVGHLWRTCGDIGNVWNFMDAGDGNAWGGSVLGNLDLQNGLEQYAGPGHWNDPDMLEIGNGGLTPEEERSHFTLWCMLAAPLMAGNDIRNMSAATRDVLTNREVVAIDQDPLGHQGYRVSFRDEIEVFVKPLQGGDTAVCLFNRGDQVKKLDFSWKDYKIGEGASIRNVWKGAAEGTTSAPYRGTIGRHEVILLRMHR
ncbi:MAG TPA: glycoside hydrolase family 27 protein [Puia sp.]|jgi:alpha-galactosidase|nr:glycoside hydrolase family 27 protein [Puia sp.]